MDGSTEGDIQEGASKRSKMCATSSVDLVPSCGSRLRLAEDFVPMCDEDVVRWMQDRQADMQEATLAGNPHEVARLCHVMGTAATSWSTVAMPPSTVSNADEDGSDQSRGASNPGPAVTRQGRRLERSTQIDVSSDVEPLVRPNYGRHVVARRCVVEGVPSTVPATPVSLAQRGRQLFPSSDVVDVVEHVLAPGPDLAFTTLRDDSDADEEVVERCHTQPTQPASAAALRGLGRGFVSNRFFSLATDSEDEEVERRTTLDEDSCSDTVSLIGRRNSRRQLRLRWSECAPIVAHSPGCEQETRVDDERLRRVREALQRDSLPPGVHAAATLIQTLAHRVGAVPPGALLPVALRRQRWSPLNVPLLWGAAGVEQSEPVLE